MKHYFRLISAVAVFALATAVTAVEDNRIIVTIPSQVAVKSDTFVLSDIANIVYQRPEQLELAQALGAIELGKSPLRYDAKDLTGETVLAAIERFGIPRDSIGYRIPAHITIARQITNDGLNKPLEETDQPAPQPAVKELPPLVVKGQAINVIYKSGLLTVNLNGIAMSSANKSEILMVKNAKSNKIIKTRVINSEQAEALKE